MNGVEILNKFVASAAAMFVVGTAIWLGYLILRTLWRLLTGASRKAVKAARSAPYAAGRVLTQAERLKQDANLAFRAGRAHEKRLDE